MGDLDVFSNKDVNIDGLGVWKVNKRNISLADRQELMSKLESYGCSYYEDHLEAVVYFTTSSGADGLPPTARMLGLPKLDLKRVNRCSVQCPIGGCDLVAEVDYARALQSGAIDMAN